MVKTLSRYGKVLISSETPLQAELESYRITVPPHQIHDVLHYAGLFIGDGATMATEAGLLGTPSIRSSSMALNMGNFVELMDKYRLVYSYYNPEEALSKAVALLEQENSKKEWMDRRDKLLSDKIDVTQYILNRLKL